MLKKFSMFIFLTFHVQQISLYASRTALVARPVAKIPPHLTADVQTETLSRRATRGYNESERDNLIPG